MIRTPSRSELLYPRSKLVTTAKAYGLQAIDMVSTDLMGPDFDAWLNDLTLT